MTIYYRYNPTTQRREFTAPVQESTWYFPQWEHDDERGWSLRPGAVRGDEVITKQQAGAYNDHRVYRFVPDESREARIEQAKERLASLPRKARPATETELVALIRAKAIHPPLPVEGSYQGRVFEALIEPNGQVVYGGHSFKSLSAAAAAAKQTITGKPLSTDGWSFWKQRVDGKLTALPRAEK